MTTTAKPYLIRAIYEWIIDNGNTPYIAVDTTFSNVTVPTEHINEDNTILLDISSAASSQLLIDNQALTCQARFGGIVNDLYVPIISIMAIYAAEDGQGMDFPREEEEEEKEIVTEPQKGRPQLKIITGEKDQTS